jgi:hypothetical protein
MELYVAFRIAIGAVLLAALVMPPLAHAKGRSVSRNDVLSVFEPTVS